MKAKFCKEVLNENYSAVTLYHRIGRTMKNWFDVVKSVKEEGLVPQGNWEGRELVWFSSNPTYYVEKGKFVVALDFDIATNGEGNNKYDMVFNKESEIGTAFNVVPFEDLRIVKVPVIEIKGETFGSDEIIAAINSGVDFTPEVLNKKFKPSIIYKDLFNQYVQPYIKIENFIDKLDKNKVILKTIDEE